MNVMVSPDFHGHWAHTWYTYIHLGKHKSKYISKRMGSLRNLLVVIENFKNILPSLTKEQKEILTTNNSKPSEHLSLSLS